MTQPRPFGGEMLAGMDRVAARAAARMAVGPVGAGFALVTHWGGGVLWAPLYAAALLVPAARSVFPVGTLLAAEALGLAVLIPARYLFRRPRPDPGYRPGPLDPWNRYSFPSHHALRVFFLAQVLGEWRTPLFPWLLVAAGAVGVSRVILRRHHLTDVVAGALAGVGIGRLCLHLFPDSH